RRDRLGPGGEASCPPSLATWLRRPSPPANPALQATLEHASRRQIRVADLPACSYCSVGWFIGKRRLGIRCRNSQAMYAPEYVARKRRQPFFGAVRNESREATSIECGGRFLPGAIRPRFLLRSESDLDQPLSSTYPRQKVARAPGSWRPRPS